LNIVPPNNSIVCIDNTITFKALYKPKSKVWYLFDDLIIKRSCTLYSTKINLDRAKQAVKRKYNNIPVSEVEQSFEYLSTFLEVKQPEFYRNKLDIALSILSNPKDDEDAHMLALAIQLQELHSTNVYLWSDDCDFYNVIDQISIYNIKLFKVVK